MIQRPKMVIYFSNPVFSFIGGIVLGGMGLCALEFIGGNAFFLQLLVLALSIGAFAIALCGLIGLDTNQIRRLSKSEAKEKRVLSQHLRVSYPDYILKVDKVKEHYRALSANFSAFRKNSDAFYRRIKVFQSALAELEVRLHRSLKKHAPVMDNMNVDGLSKKIRWTDKQIQRMQLNDVLNALPNSDAPVDVERYRKILNQVCTDLKRLDDGIAIYDELLTLCNRERADFDDILSLKKQVDEIDELVVQHERQLRNLELEAQTSYEVSETALSIFEKRFKEFKAGCD